MSEGTGNPAPLPIGWVLKSGLERHLLPFWSLLWHGAWGIFFPLDLGDFGELGQQVSRPPTPPPKPFERRLALRSRLPAVLRELVDRPNLDRRIWRLRIGTPLPPGGQTSPG